MLDELPPKETPLDFFTNVNSTRYPLFAEAKVLSVEVEAGQCLFIPAFYWMQSKTLLTGNEMAIIMNFEYESHSELLNLLFSAID